MTQAIINLDLPGATISRHLFGHFSEHLGRCVYGGIWVGPDSPTPNIRGLRRDVVEALRDLKIPNLRWPGGCFADDYHWRDGVGPQSNRPKMVNSHWGDVVEDNAFGTHEFMDLCELTGAQPYVCGNVGSGTVREMSEWVEYMTRDDDSPMSALRRSNGRDRPWALPFFGIGNESWGCGGNMTAEHYANVVRNYATYVRDQGGNQVCRIAVGPGDNDYSWTETMMASLGDLDCPRCSPTPIQALSLHYYTFTGDWRDKGDAVGFTEDEWYLAFQRAARMKALLDRHGRIMDVHDPYKKVGLVVDEWGTWWNVTAGTNPGFLQQQNTLRDALVAAIHFDAFQAHADRVVMANIAQTVNVLQSVLLTDPESGALIKTPTYHMFALNIPHMDASRLSVHLKDVPTLEVDRQELPLVGVYASVKDRAVTFSLTNLDARRPHRLSLDLRGGRVSQMAGQILTGETVNAHNTSDHLDAVIPKEFDGFEEDQSMLEVDLPPRSFVSLTATMV